MKNIKTVGIIGAGNMGEALIARIALAKKIIASDRDKDRIKFIKKNYRVGVSGDNTEVVMRSDLVILAVKPKDIDKVLFQIKPSLKDKLLVSIAAGISTSHIEKICGKSKVVRVMPNLGCLIGFGVSAITKGRFATSRDLRIVKKIFNLFGEVFEVEEKLIDAITAVSGSGPAYFFLFAELLKQAGIKIGLETELAEQLAIHTLYGSGRLIKETGLLPSELIKKVASKGGTTEAGLAVFKQNGLGRIVKQAVKAAKERARELSR